MVGQTLSHYRVLEQVGAGGMGVVYRAHDERLDRDVALKVLPPGALADEAARKRFRKEALTLSRLNHPNIGTVHDFDTQDGVDFLIMEHIAGVTLDQKLVGGALPEREISRFGVQLAEGLAAAHQQGVVHRDVKPGNLVVTDDGRLKILDFGLAKLLHPVSETAATATLTETQVAAGTLPYMPPEQLRAEKIDARSDIWAAGAVLYEMATGRRAFRERVASRLTDAILHQAPELPRAVNARISPELERIILKCLEKDPENRYQSARELSVDLRRLGAPAALPPPVWRRGVPARRRLLMAAAALMALLAVLAGFNVGGWRERLLPGSGSPKIQSLAVLPLENLSHDQEQEYFADGMTDELITDLAKISALRVISRGSVMRYKGTSKPLREIARELNVDGIIEGSVLRSGDRVRITAQLIQASTDTHLWAQSYERELRDVLALQDEVARDIVDDIEVKLTPRERAMLSSAGPVIPEAHELYLKGRYYWNKRTPDGLKKSLEYFQQAIEKDSSYALAYGGLADSYLMLGSSAYAVLPPKQAFPKAEAAAVKALQLDNTLAEAHTSLAWSRYVFDWDWQGAEREYKQAIELNPGYANAHHWYAAYLSAMGRHTEAIAEDRKAESLDPLSLIISSDLGDEALAPAGLYDQAIEQCRKTLEMDPNFAQAHACLADSFTYKGMYKEAVAEIQKAIEFSGGNLVYVSVLGYIYAVEGRRDEAIKILNELKEQSKHGFVPAGGFVLVYAGLRDKDQAFSWAERAYANREDIFSSLAIDPRLAQLRSDPRFQGLMRHVGLTQ